MLYHFTTVLFLFFVLPRLLGQELSTKYISVYGVQQESNIFPTISNYLDDYIKVDQLVPGDVIWIEGGHFGYFVDHILPRIYTPFVLVIQGSDLSFPTSFKDSIDIESFVSNPLVLHIFSQNCDYLGPQKHKVSHLPIGLDLHTLAKNKSAFNEKQASTKKQEMDLNKVLSHLSPTTKRKKKALVDFHHRDTIAKGFSNVERYLDPGETRTTIANKLKGSPVVDILEKKLPRTKYWAKKGTYAFSISPPGNGLDTHRTWEDLILGCIVIVKSCPMNPLYEGLPVVMIDDWSEINEENFTKWLNEFGDVFHNESYRRRLSLCYWMEKIKSYSPLALEWLADPEK